MSIFDNLTRKVSNTAKAAAKKSTELVEVTKLNISIGAEEEKIEKLYREIGKLVYEKYGAEEGIDEKLKELCNKIRSHLAAINEMREKILELKKVKKCPGCGTELEIDMVFCPRCGEKQELPQPKKEEASEEKEEVPEQKTCPSCETQNHADANFCSVCGTRLY